MGAYPIYRVGSEFLEGIGESQLASLLTLLWYAICAYTWIGPVVFSKFLEKELGEVDLEGY